MRPLISVYAMVSRGGEPRRMLFLMSALSIDSALSAAKAVQLTFGAPVYVGDYFFPADQHGIALRARLESFKEAAIGEGSLPHAEAKRS